jgi:hypothetical protein
MSCPTCGKTINYEPGDSAGICGGWYCDACELGVREHEVPREPVAVDVETMSAREFGGDRPLRTQISEVSSPTRISMEVLMPPDTVSADGAIAEPSEVVPPAVTSHKRSATCFTWNPRTKLADTLTLAPSRRHLASVLLAATALTLSGVGIAINGWFARSLGATDFAGWLFLAIGVAADLAALILPAAAAELWQAGQRATALVGWLIWFLTFVFAVTAGIGFAATNISDVTLSRASRLTPAITSAQAALADAMTARDRECKIVGKFCREREAAVADRRLLLDAAMTSVGQSADPQTAAAIKLVAWISRGMMRPAPEDFAMVRLALLALLPQIGGMLLMISRRQQGRPVLPPSYPSTTGQGDHCARSRSSEEG